MKTPQFSTITLLKDKHIPCINMKLNVTDIYNFKKPSDKDYIIKLLNTTIGYREHIDHINYDYWNGCVMIDVDYKKYPDATREKSIEIMKNVYLYLQHNFPNTFYYGEISSNEKGGFHFIFYLDTDYPTKERRDYLYKRSTMVIWKAFCDCGYKDIIEHEGVLDNCMNNYTQYTKMTMFGNVNKLCTGSFSGDTGLITEDEKNEFEKLNNVKNYININKNSVKTSIKALLLNKQNIDKIDYIEHATRRQLFRSLSRIYSGEELRNEWIKCAKLIPEENGHTTEYYINAPYINDWNDKLNGDEYCDKDLLKKFGYNITIIQDNTKKIQNIFN